MRLESVYVIPCLCGTTIESHEPEVVCKKCGRHLNVEHWGEPPEEPKK